jgi:hypothetical protein
MSKEKTIELIVKMLEKLDFDKKDDRRFMAQIKSIVESYIGEGR